MPARVTVISAFHNRADGVDHSLRSLAAQDGIDFRAVIVDDGSTDGTLDRLRQFESDRIRIVAQRNVGFTQTMVNHCADADTDYIALHGAGDESLPGRLAAQAAFLDQHPNVVAVGCGIENVDEISGRRWEVVPEATIKRGPMVGGFGITHGEVMFRRSAYQQAGGYRTLFQVGQATDLFRRLSRLGDFGYVPDILYRRFLRLDGVNAKLDKVAQREVLLSISAAVQRRAVEAGAPQDGSARLKDELDRYGLLFPYFSEPDAHVAQSLARAAVKLWMGGDRRLALRLGRRSLAERVTGQGLKTYAAILLGVGPLDKPMKSLVAKASKAQKENDFSRFGSRDKPGDAPTAEKIG